MEMESWESLPDVQPVKKQVQSWEDLPDVAATPAAPPVQASTPVVAPVAPATPTPTAEGGTNYLGEKPEETNYLGDALSTITPIGGIRQIEKYAVDPVLKAAQKYIGAPLMDAEIAGKKALGLGEVLPGQEYLTRAAGQMFTGKEPLEKFGGTVEGLRSVDQLVTGLHGEIPAAVAASVAQLMGQAPLFLISGPKSGVAVFDHAATGALIGLADPDMSVVEGAAGAVALHGAAKGLSGVADLMGQGVRKVVGVMDRAFIDNFSDAAGKLKLEFGAPKAEVAGYGGEAGKLEKPIKLGELGESRRVQNATGGLDKPQSTALQTMDAMVSAPASVKVVMRKATDLGESVKPLTGTVVLEDGKLIARFQEPVKNMSVNRVDIPLNNNADGMRLRGLLDRDLDTTHFRVTPEADDAMTPEMRRALKVAGSEDSPSAMEPGDSRDAFFLTQNGERLELHHIESTEGKISSLDSRGGLVAMDTPEGVKYGRAMTDEGGTHVGVSPFEPHEGIPTFGGVHPIEKLRGRTAIPDEELRSVLEKQVTPPPPPPPDVPEDMPPLPPPGPPPPPEAPITDRIAKMGQKMDFWTRVKRQLVGAHLRAPMDLASYISDQQSVKNLAANWASTNAALEKRAGTGATTEFREDVQKLFEGKLSFEDFTKKAETNDASKSAWIGIRDMMADAVSQRNANQQWLAERGYVPDETWEQSEGDAVSGYATREYMAHFLKPGQWLKIVSKDEKVMREAVTGYTAWAKKSGKELSETEALKKIVESLGTEDPGSVLFENKATAGSSAPTGKLKFRKELPEWYQNLLGKSRDGFLSTSRTLATQDALINNFKVFEGIAKDPRWAADRPVADDWMQFPDNKRLYGQMAGKWAPPDVYDSLHTIPNIKNEVNKWIAVPMGIVKTNQVSLGSFRTFLNMTMDNLMGGVLSGGLDLTKPIEAASAIRHAANAMREVSSLPMIGKANPLGSTEAAQFIRDARRIGVDAPGHIGASLNEQQARLVRNAYSEIAGVKGDASNMLTKFYELHQRLGAKGSMVVDGIDRVQKLASWKILTDKFEAEGLDHEGAMRRAARRIFQSYPMYDRVGLLADKMRTGGLGVVSPYSTFAMERHRVLGSLPGRLIDSVSNPHSDDKGLAIRMLKYALIGAGLFATRGAFRRTFGNVSDADVEYAMQKRRGSGQEKFSPEGGVWVAPWRDGRGNPAVVDMTQWLGPLSYLQGDQNLSLLANIAMNIVKQPLSGGLLGAGVDTAMRGVGIDASFEPRAPVPGQSAPAFAADAALNGGLAPRGLMDLYKNVKSTGALGDIGPGRDTLTPMQAGLRTIPGIPFEQGVTERGKQMKVSADVGHARAILFKAAIMKPDHAANVVQKVYEAMNKLAGGDPEAKRLRDEAGKMIKGISQEINKTSKAARAAKEGK